MPTDYGSPDIVLTALQTILPTGTTIATVIVKKGFTALGSVFPVLVLDVAQANRRTVELQAKQAFFTVQCIYFDVWVSSTRSLEQAQQDAMDALNNAAVNVENNQTLTVAGTDNCLRAGGNMQVQIDGAVHDMGLGFPMVTGRLLIDVMGLIYNI